MISKEMEMVREIRDRNSALHSRMTSDERRKKLNTSTEWFIKEMGKPIKIVRPGKEGKMLFFMSDLEVKNDDNS